MRSKKLRLVFPAKGRYLLFSGIYFMVWFCIVLFYYFPFIKESSHKIRSFLFTTSIILTPSFIIQIIVSKDRTYFEGRMSLFYLHLSWCIKLMSNFVVLLCSTLQIFESDVKYPIKEEIIYVLISDTLFMLIIYHYYFMSPINSEITPGIQHKRAICNWIANLSGYLFLVIFDGWSLYLWYQIEYNSKNKILLRIILTFWCLLTFISIFDQLLILYSNHIAYTHRIKYGIKVFLLRILIDILIITILLGALYTPGLDKGILHMHILKVDLPLFTLDLLLYAAATIPTCFLYSPSKSKSNVKSK